MLKERKKIMTKIVMTGLLVETKEHSRQLEDGFKKMGFHKPNFIGKFKTLAGEGGEGGRSDVVLAVHDKDITRLAVSPFHLSGGFSWAEDYLTNHKSIIPKNAYKFFEE
jgi:hypothetical protein